MYTHLQLHKIQEVHWGLLIPHYSQTHSNFTIQIKLIERVLCLFLSFAHRILNENYLWPFKTVFILDALAAAWLYPLSLTLRFAAWQSTRINIKLITVNTKQGSNFIITLNSQKLILCGEKKEKVSERERETKRIGKSDEQCE